ncbi:MAG: integrase core domain-containing protein [Isosphaeraceae bacterium]
MPSRRVRHHVARPPPAILLRGGLSKTPLSVDDARRLVAEFVNHYNHVRLHSAIAYIAPADKLAGRALAIWAARKHVPVDYLSERDRLSNSR